MIEVIVDVDLGLLIASLSIHQVFLKIFGVFFNGFGKVKFFAGSYKSVV